MRELQALGLDIDDLKDTMQDISQEGARRAAAHAPKRSGRLAASIRGNRAKSKAVVRAGKAAIPYAGPINYGWPRRHVAPSHFLQRADQEMRPVAIQMLE